ncbi:DUF6531 domain-containing protein [Actinomadura rubteroloni]|uniref:DUF6531 domain-containing protein n=1 Tax=Actinomadura rubteroloni TaxID=1926885 RepID=UPI0038B3BC55
MTRRTLPPRTYGKPPRTTSTTPPTTVRRPTGPHVGGDPIGIVTGKVFLTQNHVTLPGALPLVLERTHISSYRAGRLFGPSWAGPRHSTFDPLR